MKLSYKLAAVAALPLVLAACGADENTTGYTAQAHDMKTTLSGVIRDGLTNTALTDKSVKLTLIQGDKVRTAKMVKDVNGYYSLNGIPTNETAANQYRVVVSADGYLPYEGVVTFAMGNQNYDEYQQDEERFVVGNVNLYPIGTKAPDYSVTVTYDGKRVAGAEVIAELKGANTFFANQQAFLLNVTADNITRVSATTDANGVATFAGTSLVLGGAYNVRVLPTKIGSVGVAYNQGATLFTVGTANTNNSIALSKISNGSAEGLFITKASNEDLDSFDKDGTLTITFSTPVKLLTPVGASATFTGTATAATLGNPSATATLDAAGTTLTLKPNYATGSAAVTEKGVGVDYSLSVRLADDSINKTFNVFTLQTTSGIAIDDSVQITASY